MKKENMSLEDKRAGFAIFGTLAILNIVILVCNVLAGRTEMVAAQFISLAMIFGLVFLFLGLYRLSKKIFKE